MTESLIIAVALLCQFNHYAGPSQLQECQQFYIDCLTTNQYTIKPEPNADKLATCIKVKPIK